MDFNSLAVGSPFYVLRKTADKPILEVGTVKGKTPPQPKYQSQAVPSAFNGTNIQNVLTLTATINGQDVAFPEIPANLEIAARGNETFSGSREAMLQAVDAMIQASKKALEMESYHKAVAVEGEKMIETLNPRYAEEKRLSQSIRLLEQQRAEDKRTLDNILAILQKLDSPTPTKKPD